MDFAFSPTRRSCANSARAVPRRARASRPPCARCGTIRAASATTSGRRWPSSAGSASRLPEEHGGSGLGMVETALVLEELGRAAYPGPVPRRPSLAARAIAGGRQRRPRRSGGCRPSPRATRGPPSRCSTPSSTGVPEATATRAEPDAGAACALTGVKRFVPWAHVADVAARAGAGARGALAVPGGAGRRRASTSSPVPAMDPGMRWSDRHGSTACRSAADARLGAAGRRGRDPRRRCSGAARWAPPPRCWAPRGAASTWRSSYAKVREQFGQPIGSFQAIRHRCAEMLLEVENAHSADVLRGVGARRGRRGRARWPRRSRRPT